MKSINIRFFIPILLVLVMAAGQRAQAQESLAPVLKAPSMKARILNRLATTLELSDTQIQEIKSIVEEERKALPEKIAQLRENRKILNEMAREEEFNEAAVMTVAQDQARIWQDVILIRQKIRHRVFSLLTPDQRGRMDEIRTFFSGVNN